MNVKELIEILSKVDQEMPVATFANNHCSFDSRIKVSLCHHYTGEHLLIGNQYRKNINPPNWYITKDIHGRTEDTDEG